MPIVVSLTSAGLFVFLAGFNVWNMLSNRGKSARSSRFWNRAHRMAGYAFIALFVIVGYRMLLRVKGLSDEPPARLVLHMLLAFSLAPVLVVKVMVARYQKAARGLLMALGIGIFTIAFTLVALNVFAHYLRVASAGKAPVGTSIIFIVAVLGAALLGYSSSAKPAKPRPDALAVSLNRTLGQEPSKQDEVILSLARIEPQTHDAKSLRFLLPRGRNLAARPGQFLIFEWIIDERPTTRSYSLCSSPLQTGFIEITPKRIETGCVSRFLNDRAKVGLSVKARGPYGRFYFDESKHERIVLIAAGSGITPMMAMLRYIDDLCIPVDATLIYCVRAQQDALFGNDLAALQERLSRFRYVLALSQPGSDWIGWKGRLRREILEREVEKPLESTFFLCGPPAFMELGRSLLTGMAVEPSRILQESFGGAVAGENHPNANLGSLELQFSRSAVACRVSAEETLLESSEKNGVLIPSGCRQGSCGTCMTRLISGRVKMENEEALNEDLRARGFILPCVSRPLGDITLDA